MIKWITTNLGTTNSSNSYIENHEYIDVTDLLDKDGNSIDYIKEIIDRGVELLKNKKKVVVFCHYGMSRSNSIAAGIYASFYKCNINDAVKKILDATNEKNINIDILNSVRKAIEIDNVIKTQKQNLLITGSSGYIGQNLIKKLKEDNISYIAIDRNSYDLTTDLIQLDLLIKEKNITKILHLANPKIYSNNQSLGITLTILKNILDLCRNNNIHLFYPSSRVVYNNYLPADTPIIFEDTPVNPNDTYGMTKALCENLINHYQKIFNLQSTIIRLCPIYGAENGPLFILNFFEKALQNKTITIHKFLNGFAYLPLMHINDAVAFLNNIIANKSAPKIINVTSEENYSLLDIAQKIIDICDSSSKITYQKMTKNVFQSHFNSDIMNKITNTKKINLEEGLRGIKNYFLERRQNAPSKC